MISDNDNHLSSLSPVLRHNSTCLNYITHLMSTSVFEEVIIPIFWFAKEKLGLGEINQLT